MNLLLQRLWPTTLSTCGQLTFDGGGPTLYTLEPPRVPDIRGVACIPGGTYRVIIAPSSRFHRDMPRLLTVPGWPNDDVLIHWGNYPDDTEGCILVGEEHPVPDFIANTRTAFDVLFGKISPAAAAGDVTITVVGP